MTPAILACNVALGTLAMLALCLGTRKHYAAVFGTPAPPRRVRLLRTLGWGGVAASLAVAVHADGWNFGPVQWLGGLCIGGAAIALSFSYAVALLPHPRPPTRR